MRIIIFVIFISLIERCVTQQEGFLEFKPSMGGVEYRFKVPDGYQEKRYSGDHEFQQEYWYKDSSVFYITTFRNTYNYEVIREQGTYYERFKALNSGDTITLNGEKVNGSLWKDILNEDGVTIGYSNVPLDRLDEFEHAISSIKKLR